MQPAQSGPNKKQPALDKTAPVVQPWERIAWSPEHEHAILRDWGLFYTYKQQMDIAAKYYDKALELKEDPKALFYRSMCKRVIAKTESALQDGLAALALDDKKDYIDVEICDALYELNRFENNKEELHNNMRKYVGTKVDIFLNRLIVVDENFKDSLGDALGPFILENEKLFPKVLEAIEQETRIDTRPMWKILKEQNQCDVMSIIEKKEVFLSPREIARRERCFKVFNQLYFNKSWIDVLFIKDLLDHPNLMLPQCRLSSGFLQQLACSKYEIIKKFLKMLHARSPLYSEQMRKCPDKAIWRQEREKHLNRIQYQTHRNMYTILRSVRRLREAGKVEKLSKYVEQIMGDYVVLKTHRVMPWKFEFVTEVYNTLALAHLDRYAVTEPEKEKDKKGILTLLRVPQDKNKDRIVQFVFGDRSTYQESTAIDNSMIAYKKFLSRLEKRMRFSPYSLEKCYLLHEIARAHLKQNRFNECCLWARKAHEEAKNSNSPTWRFLSIMLMVKANAVQEKIERTKDTLDEAYSIASLLKSPMLLNFIEACKSINEDEIALKKRSQSSQAMRRSRTSISSRSNSSHFSLFAEGKDGAEVETIEALQTISSF